MDFFQIIVIVFAVFALSRVFLRAKSKNLTPQQFLLWSLLWIALIVISIIPKIANFVASFFGIGSGFNFVVYFSVVILFYTIFRIYAYIRNLEQKVTKLARIITINEVTKENPLKTTKLKKKK